MRLHTARFIALASIALACPTRAATVPVPPGSSIQSAIDAATDGDVLTLAPVTYIEDVDFRGRAITVTGAGPTTILHGTGTAPVVTFAAGEGPGSILANLTVTGGVADGGGGIYVTAASPTIVGTVVIDNRARAQGSAVYLEASSAAALRNNLIVYNGTASGDPHSVEIVNASPTIVNNTIARGDSNGIILRGASPAVIMNNVIAQNGSRIDDDRRGRGICDFSGGTAIIHYNRNGTRNDIGFTGGPYAPAWLDAP